MSRGGGKGKEKQTNAQLFGEIGISGGREGVSLTLAPDDFAGFCAAAFADVVA